MNANNDLSMMSIVQLQERLAGLVRERSNLKIRIATRQPVKTHRISLLRKEIARTMGYLHVQLMRSKHEST